MASQEETVPYTKRFLRSNPTPEYQLSDFILKQIGKGSFGLVFQAVHKATLKKFAIKQIYKPDNQVMIHHQLTVMYTLHCEYIVRLFDHFEDQLNVYLVLELIEGKQLFEGILSRKQTLEFGEVARLVQQLCFALEYIHSRQIIHRDIKPENIMLTRQGKLKLTDFGASNFLRDNQTRKTFIGTPQYIAPEIIFEEAQSFATDIWSVGVLLYELTTLKLPFNAASPALIYENVKKARFQFPVCLTKESELKDLIGRMIVKRPAERITIKEILCHPWMLKYIEAPRVGVDHWASSTQNAKDSHGTPKLNQNNSPKAEVSPFQKQSPVKNEKSEQVVKLQARLKELQQMKNQQEVPIPVVNIDEKQRLELERRISLLENKIHAADSFVQKKKTAIQLNQERNKRLQADIAEYGAIKQKHEEVRNLIEKGNQDYLSALQDRKKLKHQQLTLEYEINSRKNGIIKVRKLKIGPDLASESTAQRDRQQDKSQMTEKKSLSNINYVSQQSLVSPLQKSLSFSVSQIQSFLAEIRERKRRINCTESGNSSRRVES